MNTQSLFASEPSKVSGSRSLVGAFPGAMETCEADGGWTFWAASVWASKAIAAAKSPPVSGLPPVLGLPPMLGSGADAVFMAPGGSLAVGWLARVKGIVESESVA